jgi:hypothetical protein
MAIFENQAVSEDAEFRLIERFWIDNGELYVVI